MRHQGPIAPAVAALAVSIYDATGEPPKEIRMIPSGTFRAVDGRPGDLPGWQLDADLAAPIVAAAQARQSDYCIDYEHQTLLARENGKPAPAAGWYRSLEWRADGLWATDVRWTPAASEMIADGEYRYVSPVFGYDPETGAVRSLACAALVSNPGLDGLTDLCTRMERLAADLFQPMEHKPMDDLLEQLQWLLNLPVGSTADEILAQLTKLIDQIKADVPAAASAAAFDLGSHLQAQQQSVAALSADLGKATDPAQYVPLAALKAVQDELSTIHQAQARATLEKLIETALAAHKLLPSQLEWARDLGARDIASLARFLDVAVPVAALAGTQTGGKPPPGSGDQAIDPTAVARAAQEFQAAEETAGRRVSIADAVAHILHPR